MTRKKKKSPVKKHLMEGPGRDLQRRRHDRKVPEKPLIQLSQIPGALIVLAYIFIVTFTPNWMALDSNASKFLTLSVLNLASFVFLITSTSIRREPGVLMRFFETRAGLAYGAFLVVVLLSFTQAINIGESVLQFAKLFSVFSAAFVLSAILMRDVHLVRMIVAVGVALLIFDSLSVFYYIGQFIKGDIPDIYDIKSVYSNKNILASAIFVKTPFALYLYVFFKGWLSRVGLFSLFIGMLATFFLATRGFYVGLIVVTLVFAAYSLYNHYRERSGGHLRMLGGFLGVLIVALLIFSYVQSNLYTKTSTRHVQPVGVQLATIQDDAKESLRVDAWLWSMNIIRDNPMLGIGAGNWKVNILEYENQVNPDFIYMYKAHNDFIEIMTETGIIGGLLYILILAFIFWNLLKAVLGQERKTRQYPRLFLAGFGLLFYSFDAFFNFPADRPEIQMLFAVYLAIGIVSVLSVDKEYGSDKNAGASVPGNAPVKKNCRRNTRAWLFSVLMIILMAASSYTLYLNFKSSKIQRLVYQEVVYGPLERSSEWLAEHFPGLPSLSVWSELIATIKARYLIEENKNREAIDLLKDNHTNPYDSRREFFMAVAYRNLDKLDSALVYSKKAYGLKPYYFNNIHLLTGFLDRKGREEEIGPYLRRYLERQKNNGRAWVYAAGFYLHQGDPARAWELMEQAKHYNPHDTLVELNHRLAYHKQFIEPNREKLETARQLYDAREYGAVLEVLTRYLEVVPEDPNAERRLAATLYQLGEYSEAIAVINGYLDAYGMQPYMINMRGLSFLGLGEREKACRDFGEAMRKGHQNGERNYNNFCADQD